MDSLAKVPHWTY